MPNIDKYMLTEKERAIHYEEQLKEGLINQEFAAPYFELDTIVYQACKSQIEKYQQLQSQEIASQTSEEVKNKLERIISAINCEDETCKNNQCEYLSEWKDACTFEPISEILQAIQPLIEKARGEEGERIIAELEDIRCCADGDYLSRIEYLTQALQDKEAK